MFLFVDFNIAGVSLRLVGVFVRYQFTSLLLRFVHQNPRLRAETNGLNDIVNCVLCLFVLRFFFFLFLSRKCDKIKIYCDVLTNEANSALRESSPFSVFVFKI